MLFSIRLFRMGESDYLFDNPIWKPFKEKKNLYFSFYSPFERKNC